MQLLAAFLLGFVVALFVVAAVQKDQSMVYDNHGKPFIVYKEKLCWLSEKKNESR